MSDRNSSTALAELPSNGQQLPAQQRVSPLASTAAGRTGLEMRSFGEMYAFAKCLATSGLAPKGIDRPEAIVIALQMGMELGLPPMASLQNIAVINGRPSLWGDAQLAVCRATGELEEIDEWFEQGGKRLPRNPVTYTDDTVAVCKVKRRGQQPIETGFSVADAKRAGLWGKQGPWTQYPNRLLRFRSRSFTLRDVFGDALRGLLTTEEVNDLPRGTADAQATGSASLNKRLAVEQGRPIQPAAEDAHEPYVEPADVVDEQPDPTADELHEAGIADADAPAAEDDARPAAPRVISADEFPQIMAGIAQDRGVSPSELTALLGKVKLNNAIAKQAVRTAVVEAFAAGKLGDDGKIVE